MATRRKNKSEETRILPGTPEAEVHLGAGYKMTIVEAKQIIAERKENPLVHPYERYVDAKAFLQAYMAKPEVISTTPGWKRKRGG